MMSRRSRWPFTRDPSRRWCMCGHGRVDFRTGVDDAARSVAVASRGREDAGELAVGGSGTAVRAPRSRTQAPGPVPAVRSAGVG